VKALYALKVAVMVRQRRQCMQRQWIHGEITVGCIARGEKVSGRAMQGKRGRDVWCPYIHVGFALCQ
jgi:hypothetical protein